MEIGFAHPLAGAFSAALLSALVLARKRPGRRLYKKTMFIHPLAGFIETAAYRLPRLLTVLELLLALSISLAVASPTLSYTVVKTVEKQGVSQLNIPPRPAIVVVIDTSGSMAGWKIEAAKKAIRGLVERIRSLNASIDVGLIAFSDVVKKAIPPTANVSRILEAVDTLKPGGGTMYTYPLLTAYNWLSIYRRFNQTAVVVFATDGLPADREEYRQVLRRLAGIGVKIYTVFIGASQAGREETAYMARLGHGRSYAAENAVELAKAFNKVAEEASKTINASIEARLSIKVTKRKPLGPYLYTASAILAAIISLLRRRELGILA